MCEPELERDDPLSVLTAILVQVQHHRLHVYCCFHFVIHSYCINMTM